MHERDEPHEAAVGSNGTGLPSYTDLDAVHDMFEAIREKREDTSSVLESWNLIRLVQLYESVDETEFAKRVTFPARELRIFVPDLLGAIKREVSRRNNAKAHPIIIAMDEITRRQVEWLWWPYIAIGKVCLLDGDPGVGKSLLTVQIAANVSRGWPLPDQQGKPTLPIGDPSSCVFIATEDDIYDTVSDRLDKAGADSARIKVFNEWMDGSGETRFFTLADLPFLSACLEETQPRLVVIDSLQAVLGGKVDINRANQVTELLRPLAALAERYRCAMICLRHPSKPGQNTAKLLHRGIGSQAFMGTARQGLFVEGYPGDPSRVLMVQSKTNALPARTQVFSKRDLQFRWCGVTRITNEMMSGAAKGPSPQIFLQACAWLEARLEDGHPRPATEVQDAMKEDGFGTSTIFAAKKALGVKHSTPGIGVSTWYLPPLPVITPTTPTTPTSKANTDSYKVVEVSEVNGVVGVEEAPRGREIVSSRSRAPVVCPECQCTHLLTLDGGYRKCALCGWKG